jgi:exodeoxyribonuclease VII large subunit
VVRELDLFEADSPASEQGAWTVAAVTSHARLLVESGFRLVWVKGEVANFKTYRSGHWYFTLRDSIAQVRCVMWRDDARKLHAVPEDGIQVFVEARPTLWEERGEFRLTVRRMITTVDGGLWELQLQRAKAALERDGLLDPARKRPLPRYPARLVVVTSPDGAAFRDIISVVARRWPVADVYLVPTRVQGDGCEREICRALEVAERVPGAELIIVGRGGGSREDLWGFNREIVARAVAAMSIPTISAVGHETDVSLTDLVADARAPTPSAAAEAAVPDRSDAAGSLDGLARRLARSLTTRNRLGTERLERTADRLFGAMQIRVADGRARLSALSAKLDALSPLKILDRGYAVPRALDGIVLRSTRDFVPDLAFRLTVADGEVGAKVDPKVGPDQ